MSFRVQECDGVGENARRLREGFEGFLILEGVLLEIALDGGCRISVAPGDILCIFIATVCGVRAMTVCGAAAAFVIAPSHGRKIFQALALRLSGLLHSFGGSPRRMARPFGRMHVEKTNQKLAKSIFTVHQPNWNVVVFLVTAGTEEP